MTGLPASERHEPHGPFSSLLPKSFHPGSPVAQFESLGAFLALVLATPDSGIADIDGCQALIAPRHYLNGIPAWPLGLTLPCGTNRFSRKSVWPQAIYRESSCFTIGRLKRQVDAPGRN
jgi:hypothetical protein